MIEMLIDSIRVSLANAQRVVILKEKSAERYLPIWIGSAEADSIALKLQDVSVPRPLTHDLLRSVIVSLGASVNSIIVHELVDDTFYAKIILEVDGKRLEVDSRPSDAIALAVRTRVPIYAADTVLDKAGILLDKETGKPIIASSAQGASDKGSAKVDETELRRLSAYKDFVEQLNLDDLGKSKPENQ